MAIEAVPPILTQQGLRIKGQVVTSLFWGQDGSSQAEAGLVSCI